MAHPPHTRTATSVAQLPSVPEWDEPLPRALRGVELSRDRSLSCKCMPPEESVSHRDAAWNPVLQLMTQELAHATGLQAALCASHSLQTVSSSIISGGFMRAPPVGVRFRDVCVPLSTAAATLHADGSWALWQLFGELKYGKSMDGLVCPAAWHCMQAYVQGHNQQMCPRSKAD